MNKNAAMLITGFLLAVAAVALWNSPKIRSVVLRMLAGAALAAAGLAFGKPALLELGLPPILADLADLSVWLGIESAC